MVNKQHQSSTVEYQIRIDGKPAKFYSIMSKELLTEFLEACQKNEECYVDIARVSTDIITSQYDYSVLEAHFKDDGSTKNNG